MNFIYIHPGPGRTLSQCFRQTLLVPTLSISRVLVFKLYSPEKFSELEYVSRKMILAASRVPHFCRNKGGNAETYSMGHQRGFTGVVFR